MADISGLVRTLLEAVDIFRVISFLGVGTTSERAGAEGLFPKVPEMWPQNKGLQAKADTCSYQPEDPQDLLSPKYIRHSGSVRGLQKVQYFNSWGLAKEWIFQR